MLEGLGTGQSWDGLKELWGSFHMYEMRDWGDERRGKAEVSQNVILTTVDSASAVIYSVVLSYSVRPCHSSSLTI